MLFMGAVKMEKKYIMNGKLNMDYDLFSRMMMYYAEELATLCMFRDSKYADDIQTDSEEQRYLKDEQFLLTEIFDIDGFVKAIRYYNKPTVCKGYIKLVDNVPVLQSGTEQIQLNQLDFVERAVNQNDQNCYTEEEIYFYQLDRVKDLEDVDGMYIQIRR